MKASDVPDFGDVEAHGDPFSDLSDGLPQKYATLPRNHNPNPFQGEAPAWDRGGGAGGGGGEKREKKEKVSLLERVTGKKDARGKAANGARTASASDLCTPNPFGEDLKFGKKTETVASYSNLTFEEVVRELIKQKEVVRRKDGQIRELEDYIDNLLVRVMEETPSILRTPYEPKRKA
ncbi:hypothetical protein CRUP_013727, partial [Coryphaenoides rupestris]